MLVGLAKEVRFIAKVIGIHTLSLKLGVSAAEFEHFVLRDVFPGLGVVVQVDKTISLGFTLAGWGSDSHSLVCRGSFRRAVYPHKSSPLRPDRLSGEVVSNSRAF